jgi:hypothetical protein
MPESFVEVERVDLAYDAESGNAIEDVSLSIRESGSAGARCPGR